MSLKFADLVSATSPRAGRSPDTGGPKPDRPQAKLTSGKAAATGPGASGRKVSGSGNKTAGKSKFAHLSRFAHWAQPQQETAVPTEREIAASAIPAMGNFDHIPSGHGMRRAAMLRAAAHGFKTQGEIDAEDRQARETAQMVMNAAAKARGGRR